MQKRNGNVYGGIPDDSPYQRSAMFTVEFQMTVLTKYLEQHFDLLRRKVNDASSRLPQGCYDPIVIDDMMDVYGIFYAFTADGYDYPEMYKYAQMIKRELSILKCTNMPK